MVKSLFCPIELSLHISLVYFKAPLPAAYQEKSKAPKLIKKNLTSVQQQFAFERKKYIIVNNLDRRAYNKPNYCLIY